MRSFFSCPARRGLAPLLAALLLGPAAWGQPAVVIDSASPLPRLLAERRELVQHYEAATAQRHALFGLSNKPSKQDLQEVVTALQGIVDKDAEIVAALNLTTQRAQTTASTLQNTSRDDRNVSAQRFAELQDDLQKAQLRAQQAALRERALRADLAEAQHSRLLRDSTIAALGVLSAALLLWRRRR